MAKKVIKRKLNKKLNIYDIGGLIDSISDTSILGIDPNSKTAKVLGSLGTASGGAGTIISGGLESKAGNVISGVGNTIGGALTAVNPLIGGAVSLGSSLIGGLFNKMFGSKLNTENINAIESSNTELSNTLVRGNSNDSILNQWNSQSFGDNFTQDDIGKDGWFSNKAKNKYKELLTKQGNARQRVLQSYGNAISNVDTQNDFNILANLSAYGGPIDIFGSGAIDYELAKQDLHNKQLNAMSKYKVSSMPNSFGVLDSNVFAKGGKIHIKKANRGKFTEYCGGKVTSECIARGKKSSNPAVRKRATFAANARKWKHANGGYLYDEGGNLYTSIPNIGQHGGNFSNGVTIIGNGGTHEENPMEGVPMGIASDGTPNLVEQGEVKFNNYVFSNRLFATGGLLAAHNLPTTYANHSFADIAEKLSKESSERPNDPISKRGLMSSMTRLQQAQEQLRAEEQSNMYAKGGHLFATGGPYGYDTVLLGDPIDIEELYDAEMTPNKSSSRQGSGLSLLRYAPAIGASIGVLSDTLGLTNKPDYTSSDLIGSSINNLTEVSAKPIGNYLTYRPLDRDYYINKLNAQAGATRRAIVNQSGGNRATAMAGLLAADYNALNSLGELARKSEEYNQAQRERVAAFNRGTNQFNSEMALKAAIANKDNDKIRLQTRLAQAQLREQADARASAGRSANLTNLFDSLGEIGREEFSRNMIQSNPALYYSIGRDGTITYKNGYDELSEADKKSVREAANMDKKRKKAKGGYLTIRGGK